MSAAVDARTSAANEFLITANARVLRSAVCAATQSAGTLT
jgi:hypothetical protein